MDALPIKMYFGEMDIIAYHKFLLKNNSAIMHIPLVFNEFNMSKSNCAWIEGTFSGAACVAPAMPEFDRPGIAQYTDQASYKYQLQKLIESKSYRESQYKKSFDFISENLMLSKVNKLREDVLAWIITI